MKQGLFITGTDTGVGKTVLSALLCSALEGVYWKPIQTGASQGTDRRAVIEWAELREEQTLPESYCFEPPVSPHLAACLSGTRIELANIQPPNPPLARPLIVEGAGGVLVPVNDTEFMVDLVRHLQLPVVVATRTTLGTINHTLLTLAALRQAGVELRGVVMVGEKNLENLRAIERYGKAPVIGHVPLLESIHREVLRQVFDSYFDKSRFPECPRKH